MSKVVDVGEVVFYGGDVFASEADQLVRKPLDTGRLLYVKLRLGLSYDYTVEVIWNHFTDELIAMAAGRKSEAIVKFVDMKMARTDKVVYIDQLVDEITEKVQSLQ